MAKKTRAYVDTSAFIAFLDQSDTFHPLFVQLFADPPPLLTTPLVIAEGQGWFLKRYDSFRALQFMSFIENLKPLSIFPTGSKEISQATTHLRKFSDQEVTLTDALGLAVMQREKISTCWSTDHHLGLTGRTLIIHQR